MSAKDRQAAEANKNADSLLEEIKQEKEQAALKAEMASKRRERRRERKKKGKAKDEKDEKDKDGWDLLFMFHSYFVCLYSSL